MIIIPLRDACIKALIGLIKPPASPEDTDLVIVDGTEQRKNRPKDKEKQKVNMITNPSSPRGETSLLTC